MSNIINKIKNLTFEKINKNLVFVALLALIYRKGNFYAHFVPKPFEIVFVLVILFTGVYLITNKKVKEFFASIDNNVWIALCSLILSVLIGWLVAIFIKKIPANLNVILEFGTFIISIGIFVFVLFYTKDDQKYARLYLYALLLPVGYIVFVLFPEGISYFKLGDPTTFRGFTLNPNIISKILLVPALFFITHSLFEFKNKWLKVAYIIISCATVALLFWISSRGGLVALVISALFVWIIFIFYNFNWKKLFYSGIVLVLIFLLGFSITPQAGKQRIVLRTLYPAGSDASKYLPIRDGSKSARDVVTAFTNDDSKKPVFIYPKGEDRLKVWPFYLKYVLLNPLGIGPNTHFSFDLKDNNGEYINSGPHNTFLQIWLWGGLLGILSFSYIFISAYKNLAIKLKSNFNAEALALLGILFALSLSIMFDDSLSFFWFFIILALSLRYENTTS